MSESSRPWLTDPLFDLSRFEHAYHEIEGYRHGLPGLHLQLSFLRWVERELKKQIDEGPVFCWQSKDDGSVFTCPRESVLSFDGVELLYERSLKELSDDLHMVWNDIRMIQGELELLPETPLEDEGAAAVSAESASGLDGQKTLKKIRWEGTEGQIVTLFDVLVRLGLMPRDPKKYKRICDHFINREGKDFDNKQLSTVFQNKDESKRPQVEIEEVCRIVAERVDGRVGE